MLSHARAAEVGAGAGDLAACTLALTRDQVRHPINGKLMVLAAGAVKGPRWFCAVLGTAPAWFNARILPTG
jgi:hypothetical protein